MAIMAQDINPKSGYKLTEVGMIPEDWEVKKMSQVCNYQNGTSLEKYFNGSQGLNVISIGNYSMDGKYIDTNSYIDWKYHKEIKRFILRHDELCMILNDKTSIGAIIGRVLLIKEDNKYVFNQRSMRITPYETIFPLYLYHVINGDLLHNKIVSLAKPGTQIYVNTGDITGLDIPIPKSEEQHAIATALSDIDALITSLDSLIIKKHDIKQATMQQLLTGKTRLPGFSGKWEGKKIGDIFQFLSTANNSRSDLSEFGEIKYIHYGDIHTKWRSFLDCSRSELPFIQKDKAGNVPFLEDGDLVMADASEDYDGIGISIEVKNATGKKIIAGLHTFLLRGDKEVLADGFKGYLQYIPAVKDALKRTATGISVYGISKNNVRNISISVPDISEQQAIATVLSDMDAEIAALEHKREKTRMLKQGMMQELLTGKTRLV